MSGHSKWHNIQKTKGAQDAKRSAAFTKIAKEIIVAVKEGGGSGDPANNSRLATVIAKAKAVNMPNENIKRTIDKALGAGSTENFEAVTYEGYGPGGVAIIVQTLTDNKNRTAADVRSAFTKGQGNVGTPGCVSFMFEEKGQILVDKEELDDEKPMEADDLMMLALDAGADDFHDEDDCYEIITSPDDFSAVREALEKEGIPMAQADVVMLPVTKTALTDETARGNLRRILDLLDESDDVQNVYTNLDGDLDED